MVVVCLPARYYKKTIGYRPADGRRRIATFLERCLMLKAGGRSDIVFFCAEHQFFCIRTPLHGPADPLGQFLHLDRSSHKFLFRRAAGVLVSHDFRQLDFEKYTPEVPVRPCKSVFEKVASV
jgi:hypothetical protein